MDVSIGSQWESFVEEAVKSGRFGSASEVVREGLRLVEAREAKIEALRETLAASIAEDATRTVEDVRNAVSVRLDQWEAAQKQGA